MSQLIAACLCKSRTFTAPLPPLPLPATCCHCTSCRHTTGSLYLATTAWPDPHVDLSALHAYPFSNNTTYYSCPTCSTHLFCRGTAADSPTEVFTGALPNVPGLVSYAKHIFIGDTVDGGAAVWLGSDVEKWNGGTGSDRLPADWSPPSPPAGGDTPTATPETTPIKCHCGGVDLLLRNASDLASVAKDKVPWYVDPASFRYAANVDACDSCRLSFGVDLSFWTFAGLDHVHFANGMKSFPGDFGELRRAVEDEKVGKMKVYSSSKGVDRYFCGGCAATVFYAVDEEGRTDMVDIAVGLLGHPDGARSEGLLTWNYGSVGWTEDAGGGWREGMVRGALEGSEAWRVSKGVAKSWRRVKKEEEEKKET
ncbi:hypothetical protein OQA88_11072 [Cercophora sp. LCS_1]